MRGEFSKVGWPARLDDAFRQRSDKMLSNVRRPNRERRRLCANDVQKMQARFLLVLLGKFRREFLCRRLPYM